MLLKNEMIFLTPTRSMLSVVAVRVLVEHVFRNASRVVNVVLFPSSKVECVLQSRQICDSVTAKPHFRNLSDTNHRNDKKTIAFEQDPSPFFTKRV